MDLQRFKDKIQTEGALPLNILLDEAQNVVHKNGSMEVDAARELMQDMVDKFGIVKMISKDLRTGEMPVDDNPVKLTYNKVICIEELTELATAIIDYESYCSGSDADETVREHNEKLIDKKYALLEEFADVMICLHLMKKAYGLTDEMISKAVRIKLDNFKKKEGEKIMTLKEFAQKLNGREYNWPQFTKEELAIAKENGFIIVSGASDDLMEIEGAINDEGNCFDGSTLKLDIADGKFVDSDEEESVDVIAIEARWCKDHDDEMNVIPWTYATSVPHKKFMIYEDGKPYCQGIVFQNDALREPAAAPKTVEIELSREQFEKLKTVNGGNRARFYCKETRECFTLYND